MYVGDVKDGWNYIVYVKILCILKHVEDCSSTPMGCNAMYVGDDWNYIVYVILFMSEMSKI